MISTTQRNHKIRDEVLLYQETCTINIDRPPHPNFGMSPRFLVTPSIYTNNDENVSSSQISRPSINLLAADDQVQHNAAVPVTPQFPTLLSRPIGCDEKPHVAAQPLAYKQQKIRESLKRAAENGVSEAGRRKYELLSAAHRIVDVDPSTETPPFEKPNLFYITMLNIRTDSAEMKQLIVSMASKYGLVSELAITPHLGYFRAWIGTPDAREAVAITLMFPKNIAGRNVYTFLARSSLVSWRKMDCMWNYWQAKKDYELRRSLIDLGFSKNELVYTIHTHTLIVQCIFIFIKRYWREVCVH